LDISRRVRREKAGGFCGSSPKSPGFTRECAKLRNVRGGPSLRRRFENLAPRVSILNPTSVKIIVWRFDGRKAFVPEGQADRSQARSAWVSAVWTFYCAYSKRPKDERKAARGFSPGKARRLALTKQDRIMLPAGLDILGRPKGDRSHSEFPQNAGVPADLCREDSMHNQACIGWLEIEWSEVGAI
jgi:hypothetical protein